MERVVINIVTTIA